ncbi:MAG: flavodoxin family protein [Clostridia bacterium]|nr:flavodoxin family protein [Clostridia bacterium]
MKTLIINGSPRRQGDCAYIEQELRNRLEGEVISVSAYRDGIAPCIDCRGCQRNYGCVVKDGMKVIYDAIESCDNIILISPVYYRNLTPPMLNILSRMQVNFSSKFYHGREFVKKGKRGAFFLVGGGSGKPDMAAVTSRIILHQLGASDPLYEDGYFDTDNVMLRDLPDAGQRIDALAEWVKGM